MSPPQGQSSFGGGLGGHVDFLVAGNGNQSWLALAKKQFGGKEVVYRMEGKTERIRPQKRRCQVGQVWRRSRKQKVTD